MIKMTNYLQPQTFYPTLEQWKDLPSYVSYIESQGGHLAGIVKITAPAEWEPNNKTREDRYNPSDIDVMIENPLRQTIKPTPTHGAFQSTSQSQPPISVENFVKLATSDRYVTPPHESYDQLDDIYWSYDMIDRADDPIYGADVPATLIDEDKKIWNVGKDETIFNDFGRRLTRVDEGAYLYFGMWKSTFSWHIEDMDLYGVNYLHYGAPKSWYCVPPSDGYKLELAAKQLFPDWSRICYNFLRHKVCMISPKLLRKRGVKVNKVVQEERDLIIVFPHAYHAGFNHGFNIAEASNFGTPRWVEHGKRHRACTCSMSDSVVKIDMDPLISRFQPDILETWRLGEDIQPHPDDGVQIRNVWRFCQQTLESTGVDIDRFGDCPIFAPKKIKHIVEGSEELEIEYVDLTRDEKIVILKKQCQLQINHFIKFREVLPSIKMLLDLEDDLKEVEEETDNGSESDKENVFQVDKKAEREIRLNMDILKKASKVKVKINKQKFLKDYVDKLPKKQEEKPRKVQKSGSTEVLKRHGFSAVSYEELEAKRAMKKCKYKHKFWPCRKCSGCVRPDCGICEFCKDKPKFGGHNIKKQKCIHKKCSNPIVRSCEHCTWNL